MKAISTTLRHLCEAQRQQSLETTDMTHTYKAQESCSRRQRESDCAQEMRPRDSRTESHERNWEREL